MEILCLIVISHLKGYDQKKNISFITGAALEKRWVNIKKRYKVRKFGNLRM